ncbi:hypothetical protein BGZ81_000202 [Podila clonocystis]|nr:hypothetical protein BGZ81_000202 [Podila clonocystis]
MQQQHQYAHVPQYGMPPPPGYPHMMPPPQAMMPPPPLGGAPPSGVPQGYGGYAAPSSHDSMRGPPPPRSPPRYRGAPGYRERSYSPPRRRTPSPRGYRDVRSGYDRPPPSYSRGYDRGGYDRGYDRSDRGYDRFDRGYERGYDRYDRGYGGHRGYDRGYGARPRSPPRRSRTINRGTEEDRLASKTLYIGNIPYSFREPEVEDMFKKFGTITKVTVVLDQYTQRNKGFAFVEYEDRKAAEEAVERYNGFDVEGRRLKIDWDIGLGKKDIKPPRLTGDGHGTADIPPHSQNDHDEPHSQRQHSENGAAQAPEVTTSHDDPVDEPLHVEQAPYATSTEQYQPPETTQPEGEKDSDAENTTAPAVLEIVD